VALVHPIAAALSPYSWAADLFSHFREPGLLVTALALVVMLIGRRFRVAAGLGILAIVQAVSLTGFLGRNPVLPDPAAPPPLRVLMVNVHDENPTYQGVADLIRKERPDVVGLVEFTARCSQTLSDLHSDYPYRVEWPAGARGIALWFRRAPVFINQPAQFVRGGNPVIHGLIEYAGRPRHIWVVHTINPFWRAWESGNAELDAIAERVGTTPGSRIVVGDMNTTEGSAHFRNFLRVSGLRDSRLGFGRQGSWPTDFFYRLPIDHAFVSDELAVVDRRLGPSVGSDHLPLLLDLAPAARPAMTAEAQASTSPGSR
jgi:endonuclease/exonuclease/phosphatase (EEP) superfamily protein YafD